MVKFALKTKKGEVINTTSADDLQGAAENFAAIKKLSVNELLKIFNVDIFVR